MFAAILGVLWGDMNPKMGARGWLRDSERHRKVDVNGSDLQAVHRRLSRPSLAEALSERGICHGGDEKMASGTQGQAQCQVPCVTAVSH